MAARIEGGKGCAGVGGTNGCTNGDTRGAHKKDTEKKEKRCTLLERRAKLGRNKKKVGRCSLIIPGM